MLEIRVTESTIHYTFLSPHRWIFRRTARRRDSRRTGFRSFTACGTSHEWFPFLPSVLVSIFTACGWSGYGNTGGTGTSPLTPLQLYCEPSRLFSCNSSRLLDVASIELINAASIQPSCSTWSLNLVSRDLRTHDGTTSTPPSLPLCGSGKVCEWCSARAALHGDRNIESVIWGEDGSIHIMRPTPWETFWARCCGEVFQIRGAQLPHLFPPFSFITLPAQAVLSRAYMLAFAHEACDEWSATGRHGRRVMGFTRRLHARLGHRHCGGEK